MFRGGWGGEIGQQNIQLSHRTTVCLFSSHDQPCVLLHITMMLKIWYACHWYTPVGHIRWQGEVTYTVI